MQLVTVGTYDNLIEAELAKLQLESACIDAVLKDAEMVHLMPIYNLTIGGIKLLVRQVDEQKATAILENQFIPSTSSNWGDGEFRWGFSISRTFTLKEDYEDYDW